jgi:hypothetical protein
LHLTGAHPLGNNNQLLPIPRFRVYLGTTSAWLGGGSERHLGSNEAMLRGILLFKISRFIDCNPAYPVEVAFAVANCISPCARIKAMTKESFVSQAYHRTMETGYYEAQRQR